MTFSSTVMFLKSRRFWNVRAMPLLVIRWGLSLHDRLALEPDVACVGPVEPGQAIEDRGLAGAVGADEADDGAFLDIEAEAVDDVQPPEAQRQIVNL